MHGLDIEPIMSYEAYPLEEDDPRRNGHDDLAVVVTSGDPNDELSGSMQTKDAEKYAEALTLVRRLQMVLSFVGHHNPAMQQVGSALNGVVVRFFAKDEPETAMPNEAADKQLQKLGLTEGEIRCFKLTVDFWNRFLSLPKEHDIAQPIVHAAVVSLQQTLLARPALRILNPVKQETTEVSSAPKDVSVSDPRLSFGRMLMTMESLLAKMTHQVGDDEARNVYAAALSSLRVLLQQEFDLEGYLPYEDVSGV